MTYLPNSDNVLRHVHLPSVHITYEEVEAHLEDAVTYHLLKGDTLTERYTSPDDRVHYGPAEITILNHHDGVEVRVR